MLGESTAVAGDLIREIRRESGLTQAELEEKFRSCAHLVPVALQDRLLDGITGLQRGTPPGALIDALGALRLPAAA